jgi:hypothetical protein
MCWISSVLLAAVVGVGAQPDRAPGVNSATGDYVGSARAQPAGNAVAGDDGFRVETAVYGNDERRPGCRITTIFSGGAVYDCTTEPAETVVFEPLAGRFVILSQKHQLRTELATADVKALTDRLRQKAAKSSDPLAKFFAEPKFKQEYDQPAAELTLTSPLVTYDVTLTRESDPAVVEQYRVFRDWSARLSAVLMPAGQPPFARMAVNAAIAERRATPSRVFLIVSNPKDPKAKRTTMHSDHRIIRPLARADLDRVAEIRESMASFKPIGFEQYRKLDLR